MTEQCPCGRPLDPTVFHDGLNDGMAMRETQTEQPTET